MLMKGTKNIMGKRVLRFSNKARFTKVVPAMRVLFFRVCPVHHDDHTPIGTDIYHCICTQACIPIMQINDDICCMRRQPWISCGAFWPSIACCRPSKLWASCNQQHHTSRQTLQCPLTLIRFGSPSDCITCVAYNHCSLSVY